MTSHKYTIIMQTFNETQTLFRLSKIGEHGFVEKTAQEISADNDLLNALSSRDAHLIGYVSASEKILLDFNVLSNKKFCRPLIL